MLLSRRLKTLSPLLPVGTLISLKYATNGLPFDDRTILALRDVRHNIIRRAADTKETERWMVEKWLREVYDDKILHAFRADLQTKSEQTSCRLPRISDSGR
jgi:hypothetical protein